MEGGERAITRFEEGVQGYETRAFRGLGVFSSTPYEVSDDQDSVQMLQRSSQVGEFYRMSPPPVWDARKPLPPQYMDIMIYDEETDQLKHIPFSQALYACGLDDAELMKALDWANMKAKYVQDKFDTDGKTVLKGDRGYPAIRAAKGDFEGNFTNDLIAAVAAGAWVPVCITIARPFMEHLMMSAVATVSGRDTGATLFGPADMQISANTSVKTIEGYARPLELTNSPLVPNPVIRSLPHTHTHNRRAQRSSGALDPGACHGSQLITHNPSQALYLPHEECRDEAAKRLRDAGHNVHWLRRRRQHSLLWCRGQGTQQGNRHKQSAGGDVGEAVVRRRRFGRVRLDARIRVPVWRGRGVVARSGHLDQRASATVGGV